MFHTFSITLKAAGNPFAVRNAVVELLQERCRHFEEVGRRYWSMVSRKFDTTLPDPAPFLRIETTNFGEFVFRVTFFCPTGEAVALEQAITGDIIALYGALPPPAASSA